MMKYSNNKWYSFTVKFMIDIINLQIYNRKEKLFKYESSTCFSIFRR